MKAIMPILLIVVSVGLFYLHIDPRYETVRGLILEKNQYEEAILKAEELSSVRDELLTKYNALPKEDLAKLERLLPTNLNTVKLVADISSIGGPYGIAIRSINVKEQATDVGQSVETLEKVKPYQTTVISFKFSSTYPNLVSFLKDIEKSLQLVDVRSVTFSTNDNSNLSDYDVTIQTYWLK